MTEKTIRSAAAHFKFEGEFRSYSMIETGNINNTFIIDYVTEIGGVRQYILQRLNTDVFTKPYDVMENIDRVTTHIRRKMRERGIDPTNRVLRCIKTIAGSVLHRDENDLFWRAYNVITNTKTFSSAETPERFYKVGYAFGQFQLMLSDFPAEDLNETIPDFHNTAKRYDALMKAVEADPCGRAESVAAEIEFVKEREEICPYLCNGIKSGKFPLRVTHNDTKMDNILVDVTTGEGKCVIDLDTVMPGTVLNDFGDAIRFGAATTAEDDPNLENVGLRLDMFEAFTRGFIKGLANSLIDDEIRSFPMGVRVLTFELGIRFLTDYINGDTYFRTTREGHNLDRARNQFRLVEDIEAKTGEMQKIVDSLI